MKVLIVFKKSAFEIYSQSPDEEVQRFMASGEDAERLEASHRRQAETLRAVIDAFDRPGFDAEAIYRGHFEEIGDHDLIVSVGGDGTFLEVSHAVYHVPILGINSDPVCSTGFFTIGNKDNVRDVADQLGDLPRTTLHRFGITLDGAPLPVPVLNDVLLAHINPAAVTRYQVEGEEPTRGSGLLVSTSAGSTGWIRQEGGETMPLSDDRLQVHSRGVRGAGFHFATTVTVRSLTRQACLFVDGAHLCYPVDLGATIAVAPALPLEVIGDLTLKDR